MQRIGRPGESSDGFHRAETEAVLPGVTAHIVGSHDNAGSRRTRRRLANYRVGAEGRISHLKRGYGAGRPRLKGRQGARIWEGWSALAKRGWRVASGGLGGANPCASQASCARAPQRFRTTIQSP